MRVAPISEGRAAAHGHHVDFRILRALGRRARTDLDENGIAIGPVDDAMTVRNTGLPGCGIACLQHGLALVLAQHNFAFEHVDEFVLILMPMALR
jgi:hypothetical protein